MAYSIKVKQGDLLKEENATFIVNASNTQLMLGSGVSMAFKRDCGAELQQEMKALLNQRENRLKQGDVVLTSSGKAANFKYALHVVVMDYEIGTKPDDKFPQLEHIRIALQKIEDYLVYYAQNGESHLKLVLPLLGCGVGRLDKEEVIKLYKAFFSRNTELDCEVIVYGYDEDDAMLINKHIL